MSNYLHPKNLLTLLGASALIAAPPGAGAQDSTYSDDWQYTASVYLWGAGMKGETAAGSELDIGFDTLIDNLNMAFMGAFEARRSRLSFLTDVVYLNVGSNDGGEVPVPVAPDSNATVKVDASIKAKTWVLNLIGGYNLWQTEQGSLDMLAGARYLDMELDFGLGLGVGQYAASREISASGSVWDAVVGVKGYANLNKTWYLPFHLDIGAGQSDLTWQASAGVGYRFDWGDVSLVYRHIEWDFDSDRQIDNISTSGPLLAAKFHF